MEKRGDLVTRLFTCQKAKVIALEQKHEKDT